ncbi:hypothetical protein BDZ97DRAFT_2065045 [Flammula alnicola]|nr:hypothetical protein BDZ97DRAFT_2065045 [Flammula alnicola]
MQSFHKLSALLALGVLLSWTTTLGALAVPVQGNAVAGVVDHSVNLGKWSRRIGDPRKRGLDIRDDAEGAYDELKKPKKWSPGWTPTNTTESASPASSVVPIASPMGEIPVTTAAPVDIPIPTVAIPTDVPTPVDTIAPTDTPAPTDTFVPVDTPAPVDIPVPTDTLIPTDIPIPTEAAPTPSDTATSPDATPTDTFTPAEFAPVADHALIAPRNPLRIPGIPPFNGGITGPGPVGIPAEIKGTAAISGAITNADDVLGPDL